MFSLRVKFLFLMSISSLIPIFDSSFFIFSINLLITKSSKSRLNLLDLEVSGTTVKILFYIIEFFLRVS